MLNLTSIKVTIANRVVHIGATWDVLGFEGLLLSMGCLANYRKVISHRERHDGGFNIVHIKDAIDNTFATRETNVFVIGQEKPWISLPKGKGVKVFKTLYFSQHS